MSDPLLASDLPPVEDSLPDEAHPEGPKPDEGQPPAVTGDEEGPPAPPAKPEAALAFLRANLNIGEHPPGSNQNQIATDFFEAAGRPRELAGGAYAWCAATVSLALNTAWGDPTTWRVPGVAATYDSGTAYVPALRQFFIDADLFDDEPRVGDVVIFGPPGSDGEHTGLVERVVGDGTVVTLEGNFGDDLLQVRRSLDVIVGFGHPPYDIEEDPFVSLSPEQQDDLLQTTKATNAAVGRLEVAVRDSVSGLQAQVDALKSKIDQLLQP